MHLEHMMSSVYNNLCYRNGSGTIENEIYNKQIQIRKKICKIISLYSKYFKIIGQFLSVFLFSYIHRI